MAEIVVKLVNGELAGKTAQSISKEVNAAALALKKAEIGTKEWAAASKKLEETKQLQGDLKKQIEGTASASDTLKKSFNKLPGAEFFNKIGESFGMMKSGVGGLVSQFGLLKTAIASTGIGLLILVLSSLISYFTSTQEGIDKITAVTRPLKAIFDALVGVLQKLGGTVFKQLSEAIQNPMQALKDLGQILLDNVINRFKAFALIGPAISKLLKGDLVEGFKDLGNAALQSVTGIENVIDKVSDAVKALASVVEAAAEKGKRIDELQKQIERAEINQIKRSKEIELGIKRQKDIVEDVTKSWDERRAAAEKALALQNLALDLELNLLDKRIEKMEIEHSLNDTLNDQKKELSELEAKRFEVQAKQTEQGIEFKKKISEFDKAQAAEQLATLRNIEDLRLQILSDGADKEIEKIMLDTERKIETLKGTAAQITEQKVLLEEVEAQAIQAVRDKYAAEQADKDTKAAEDKTKLDKDAADKKKTLDKETADFAREMDNVRIDSTLTLTNFLAEAIGKQISDEKDAKRIRKITALSEVGINLFKEKAANAVTSAANPLNAVTFGAAGAAQLFALNQASNIRAAIAAVRIVAFKKGGIPSGVLQGPSHDQGGIPLVAEGNEIILTKGVYQNPALRAMASDINVAGGGRRFEAGGVSNPFDNSRGAISSSVAGGITNSLEQRIIDLTESMNNRIDRIQVTNNLQETNTGLGVLNKLKADADV